MTSARISRAHWIGILYCASGCAGLIYETVWIRAFALSFGSTLLSFSTVVSVFLGGLAIGAALGGRWRIARPLLYYGAAELWVAGYALFVPALISATSRWLVPLYGPSPAEAAHVSIARAALCALILLPATVPMGAGLPFLFSALKAEAHHPRLIWIYALNTLGGAGGAILSGLVLLPWLGYWRTLVTASVLDAAVGLFAIYLARVAVKPSEIAPSTPPVRRSGETFLSPRALALAAFFTGATAMLYEVAALRVSGLLFGPTAATVTLTLAVVLFGLAAGGALASVISQSLPEWLSASQLAVALLLLAAAYAVAISPAWIANEIRLYSGDASRIELLEAASIFLLLFPLTTAAGMALPLAMSYREHAAQNTGRALGGLYGINTAGCIVGSLLTGWFLIPQFGAERTLYAGALINAVVGITLIPRMRWRAVGGVAAVAIVAALVFPQWDMGAMTSGAYKYAPYYSGSVAGGLHNGELQYLREGRAGTVTVRRIGASEVLAIDGKVDASDAGGDLLTEKLLAHLPLSLIANPRKICVIGLASGVTAGAALTYPIDRLDVLELSSEVVQASRFFDRVNGNPLQSSRTRLIVNDGRNHLALTSERYNAILSEPSNPWISGMNSMFTREFFTLARSRLAPGGVLAQWFHLYNMPADDLRSLLRAFTDVFPSATLWQLNEGDVLLTGIADDSADRRATRRTNLPAAALSDLAQAGVSDPALLSTLYIMRGADLARFARTAKPNTDDWPALEFHGLRDLDLQTSESNLRQLTAFDQHVRPPAEVIDAPAHMTGELLLARARMFEKAESYSLAFASYQKAFAERRGDPELLAGMLRTARSSEEQAAAGTLATRTTEALNDMRNGDVVSAERLLRAVKEAWPDRAEAQLNYGLFCLDNSRYDEAIASFHTALQDDPRYVPALEAMAKTYLRTRDLENAALWSRRILEIDPTHVAARQALEALERAGVVAPAEH